MTHGRRWLGVGHGTEPDSFTAGRAAALAAVRGPDPALLVVFASGVADPAAMLAGIESACRGVPLVGCSSELLVTPDAAAVHGVVVTALGGPGFRVHTGAGSCAGAARRAGGAQAARCLAGLAAGAGPQRALLLLTDGWVNEQEEILAGAYGVAGASLPMIGGSASPDPAVGRPYQLHGRGVLHEAAVAAVIASDGPLGFGVRHGWRKVGDPMIVTRAQDGAVQTLDDRPALAAYLDRYGAPEPAYNDRMVFERFAQSRPIGVRRRGGVEVRSVSSSAGLGEGTLCPTGEVPEGALVWPMTGDAGSALAAAGDACRDAVAALRPDAPLGLLAFDCVSRSHMLGAEGTRQEIDRMREQAAGVPVSGIYTWGEILRTRGMNGYHNQTLAVLAVG